ncbi:hypothetical protein AYO21_07524 [Fonsecaea monophora]|uniref:Uncharacterized protein n=1 Tax=Fonsecaea monophora TaxID=254056 RepID=A0A177F222_9EURO|nr:hypothetical protein AYO21_07524 [Fonsecaea monophora]OAG38298.1 hypothetical protein AYO21_07524 [Fonsecaea monophora]
MSMKALKPEEIIAGINRQVEFLTDSLEVEKKEKEGLQEKVAGLQSELNAARREHETLQQRIDEGKSSAATIDQQNGTLRQELVEGRWDTDAVHRHNEGLQMEISMLQDQVMDLQAQSYNAFVQAEHAWEEVVGRDRYIHGMHGHIAFIESHSAEGRAASHAAFQNMEGFFQTQLNSASSESRELRDNLANLQRFVDERTKDDESKQDALTKQLATARANVSVAEHRQKTLEYKLLKSGKEIKAIKQTSASLVEARDSLNKQLLNDLDKNKKARASASAKHRKTQAKAKQVAKETAQATAAAEELMRKEIARLGNKIKEQEAMVLAEQMHHDKLESDISAEQKRQKDFQVALAAAERDAAHHKELTESLQRRIKSMKTRGSGLSQAIRDQEVTIQRLHDRAKELEAEAVKERRLAALRQDELDAQRAINDQQAKDNAALRGYSLANTHAMIEELGRDKYSVFVRILEEVFGRVANLDSAPAANRAVDGVRAFLSGARERINDYKTLVYDDMDAINNLISDIEKITPARAANKDDIEQVMRLFGGVKALELDVSSLLLGAKAEIATRGPGQDSKNRRMMDFTNPAGLLTGGASKRPSIP